MIEIEWPATITDNTRNFIMGLLPQQPTKEELRIVCGMEMAKSSSELSERYENRNDVDVAKALLSYLNTAYLIMRPDMVAHSYRIQMSMVHQMSLGMYPKRESRLTERRYNKIATDLLQTQEQLGKMLSEDPTGFLIVDSFINRHRSSKNPISVGFIAAANRYKQLYKHFAELFEVQ